MHMLRIYEKVEGKLALFIFVGEFGFDWMGVLGLACPNYLCMPF